METSRGNYILWFASKIFFLLRIIPPHLAEAVLAALLAGRLYSNRRWSSPKYGSHLKSEISSMKQRFIMQCLSTLFGISTLYMISTIFTQLRCIEVKLTPNYIWTKLFRWRGKTWMKYLWSRIISLDVSRSFQVSQDDSSRMAHVHCAQLWDRQICLDNLLGAMLW